MDREAFFIVKQVKKTIEQYNMFHGCKKVIVALSGGADSVCLLSILQQVSKQYQIDVEAAHVNHNLRGEASEADENFVRELCRRWNVPLTVKKVDILYLCEKQKIAVEEAGRNARYAFFSEIVDHDPSIRIATAHNRNDNAETLVMHFMRGAGIDGLAGIPYVRGNIVRPILDLTRKQVERYNQQMHLSFVIDQTNGENIVTRNRIRNALIPQLEQEYNPNLIQTLTRSSEFIRIDQAFLDRQCMGILENSTIKRSEDVWILKWEPLRKIDFSMCIRIMRKAAFELGNDIFPDVDWFRRVWYAIQGNSARRILYQDKMAISMESNWVSISSYCPSGNSGEFYCRLNLNRNTWVEQLKRDIWMEIVPKAGKLPEDAIFFDADKVSGDVIIRSREAGDYFYPIGVGGKKKVKDYLIDRKIPLAERSLVPVICCDAGIMIVDNRVDSRFCVSADTKKILMIKL